LEASRLRKPTEEVTNNRRGQAFVGNEAIFNGVAEVDEFYHEYKPLVDMQLRLEAEYIRAHQSMKQPILRQVLQGGFNGNTGSSHRWYDTRCNPVKRSAKAALLSALVFPGIGHIYLKRYLSGIILAGVSFAAIYYLTAKMVEKSLQILEKIQSGSIPLNTRAITELLSKQSTGAESQLLSMATAVFIICWLIGILDSYRVGRLRDKID